MPGDVLRALLVEDNPDDATLFHKLVQPRARSLAVTCAPTLAAALEQVRRQPLDVILLDLHLPDADGTSLVSRVREAAPAVPIVVLTGLDDEAAALRSLHAGAQDYLVKGDFDARTLLRVVRYAMERQRMATELAEANARLRELDQFRTLFVSSSVHEIANVLTPLVTHAHLLQREGAVAPGHEESLDALQRNLGHMRDLLRDVMDAGKLQAGRLPLQRVRMDVAGIGQAAVEAFRPAASEAGVDLRAAITPGLDVEGDPKRLTQVAYNLLGNALKFTPRGGSVTVSAKRAGSAALLSIADTGPGLAPEQMARLFEPFSQVLDAAQNAKGTGLGLFITRGIVEQHGGAVRVQSDGPGTGSTFTVELPLAPRQEPHAAASAPAMQTTAR